MGKIHNQSLFVRFVVFRDDPKSGNFIIMCMGGIRMSAMQKGQRHHILQSLL